MSRTEGESLISRVTRVLEAFDRDNESMPLSTLAHRAGLPIPTTYRLVTEMVKYGLLDRASDKDIKIGLHLWELASHGNRGVGLRDAALPFMVDLQSAVHEVVTLAVLDGQSALFLERLAPAQTTLEAGRIAERHLLHASSSGLVLLAFASQEYQNEVLSRPLERLTDKTVTNPDQLRRLLADVRQRHFVYADGYGRPGWTGVAVPVFGRKHEVVASLSIVYRSRDESPQSQLAAMRTAAAGISRTLTAPY
ncbi:IclR family transcriptional regulator [Rhodococcus sp. T7]|uniref:IclR family transcriptional regulator n=1 Tax=Rhodococcus sp. T7 TaxID=627444 RepID=UPI0013581AE6|nr:IclR family transcriptional regulator [Rhodococcus sp. T7]KAF0960326.1 Pectin degradation repressor protein KdgR [Rhodococcus sp. T7]